MSITTQPNENVPEPQATEQPHDIILQSYEPTDLPDFDVFCEVVECTNDTVEQLIEQEY